MNLDLNPTHKKEGSKIINRKWIRVTFCVLKSNHGEDNALTQLKLLHENIQLARDNNDLHLVLNQPETFMEKIPI